MQISPVSPAQYVIKPDVPYTSDTTLPLMIKAYNGALPEGARGVAFTTPVRPNDVGTREVLVADNAFNVLLDYDRWSATIEDEFDADDDLSGSALSNHNRFVKNLRAAAASG